MPRQTKRPDFLDTFRVPCDILSLNQCKVSFPVMQALEPDVDVQNFPKLKMYVFRVSLGFLMSPSNIGAPQHQVVRYLNPQLIPLLFVELSSRMNERKIFEENLIRIRGPAEPWNMYLKGYCFLDFWNPCHLCSLYFKTLGKGLCIKLFISVLSKILRGFFFFLIMVSVFPTKSRFSDIFIC